MLIMCTDGMSNIGLGSLENGDNDQVSQFYESLAYKAQEKGIIISVITMKGEGCKMEILGKLAQITNGNVERIDPSDLTKDFGAILKDEIVATKVEFKIRLHKALKFRNEIDQ